MTNTFCPECGASIPGKKTDTQEIPLCDSCYATKIDPLNSPREIELEICNSCGSYKIKEEWLSSNEYKPLIDIVMEKTQNELKIHQEVNQPKISIEPERIAEDRFKIDIYMEGEIRGIDFEDTDNTLVTINSESCPTCQGLSSGYYESIVQIRARNRQPTEEEKNRALEIAYDIASKDYTDRDTYVSRTEENDDGVDIYLSSTKMGLDISRKMTREFGGDYQDSATVVGREDGLDSHRVTYSVRLPRYRRGDIVESNGDVILVKISNDNIKGIDLETGNEKSIDLDGSSKIAEYKDAVNTTLVSKNSGEVMVIDPESLETVTLKQPSFISGIEEGEDVRAIHTEESTYLLPRNLE